MESLKGTFKLLFVEYVSKFPSVLYFLTSGLFSDLDELYEIYKITVKEQRRYKWWDINFNQLRFSTQHICLHNRSQVVYGVIRYCAIWEEKREKAWLPDLYNSIQQTMGFTFYFFAAFHVIVIKLGLKFK